MREPDSTPDDQSLVTPTQIAKLTGVGRAAVSNWRRRYADFPQPAGGTVNSPLFAWRDVEPWLAANGRFSTASALKSTEDRIHHQLGSDGLADLIERLAADTDLTDPALAAWFTTVLPNRDRLDVAAGLAEREASRARTGEFGPMPKVAEVVASLLPEGRRGLSPQSVLDPRCGLGSLLPHLSRHLGPALHYVVQDPSRPHVRSTVAMLNIAGCEDVEGIVADALSAGGKRSADANADVVVCAVPSGKALSETAISATDPRWVFGVPPQSAPEFAWLQHCYSRLAPGGTCAVVMSSNAATNHLGRQIRSMLVKSGALHSVLTLPLGLVPGVNRSGQIWILNRPDGSPQPRHSVRMIDVSQMDPEQLDPVIKDRWREVSRDPQLSCDVPLIDLLDGDVEFLPARWLAPPARDVAAPFRRIRRELMDLLRLLPSTVPNLEESQQVSAEEVGDTLTVGALARSGAVEILSGGTPTVLGDILVDPLELDRSRIVFDPEQVGERVKTSIVRCDPEQIDPYFLLGHLRTTANRRITGTLGSRNDVRKARIPRVPIAEQRHHGANIKTLIRFATLSAQARTLGDELVALAFDGLSTGALSGGYRRRSADDTTTRTTTDQIDQEESRPRA